MLYLTWFLTTSMSIPYQASSTTLSREKNTSFFNGFAIRWAIFASHVVCARVGPPSMNPSSKSCIAYPSKKVKPMDLVFEYTETQELSKLVKLESYRLITELENIQSRHSSNSDITSCKETIRLRNSTIS